MKIHKVWHDFMDRFMLSSGEFKDVGYDLMLAVEEWAKRYPDDVAIVRCDDAYHTGSDLVLISHKDGRQYWGTTVVFLPQNGIPTQFFLYEFHRMQLVAALTALRLPPIRED